MITELMHRLCMYIWSYDYVHNSRYPGRNCATQPCIHSKNLVAPPTSPAALELGVQQAVRDHLHLRDGANAGCEDENKSYTGPQADLERSDNQNVRRGWETQESLIDQ